MNEDNSAVIPKKKVFSMVEIKAWFRARTIQILMTVIIIAGSAYAGQHYSLGTQITWYKAGTYSVSINERNEMTLINRDKGNPIIIDSTLTHVVMNMLASKEAARINQ